MRHKFFAAVAFLFGLAVPLASAGPAAAAIANKPLPASDYSVRPLCGAPGPGHVACFSLELVPQTAAAREHATPIGMTLHHTVEPQSAASGTFGLRPQDLHSAYGLPTKAPAPQTIAIVDAYDDPTAEADLKAYDEEFHLPECTTANGCFKKVNQAGEEGNLPSYNAGWAGEIALDVESAHAVCQENCRILLVEANNAIISSLEAAEETAVRMGATEISNSYGGPESGAEGSAYNHPGVAITVSTGDDGYLNWSSSEAGFAGHPNYPASSPDVVAVGGTRLTVNGGAREGERVWNDGSTRGNGHGAGGGGCSQNPEAQEWQRSVGDWSEVGCGTKRAAADVAADADPYSGVAVYRSGGWSTVGGTSLASPIIAATFALAGGTGGVSYPAQTLYSHIGSPSLHDVTEGSNGECTKAFNNASKTAGCTTAEEEQDCGGKLICRAAVGYDGPTGVGTPAGVVAFQPPAPTVTAISPSDGGLGTVVTITGEYLKGVSEVKFGGASATQVVEDSPTELTVTSPGHAEGQVDVTVTTGGGTSATSAADKFSYLFLPVVEKVEPAEGPLAGGTLVTIKGRELGGATAVEFDGLSGSGLDVKSAEEIQVKTPAHSAGTVDVAVTNSAGTSNTEAADRFTYVAAPVAKAPLPTISGYPIEGRTLTDVHGGWENAPTSYSYQWLRCEGSGGNCTNVAGATAQSYKLLPEDVGHAFKVEETAINAGGQATAASAATLEVVARTAQLFTWSGETPLNSGGDPHDWSEGTNWEGGVAPSESVDIGTLSFPSISGEAACATESSEDACYESINDLGAMEVEKISIDDLTPLGYRVAGEAITLGSGGIEGATTPSTEFGLYAYLSMPIALSADQTWSISGYSPTDTFGGVELGGAITGGSHTVKMKFENGGGIGLGASPVDDEMGEVSVEGANPAITGGEAFKNGQLSFALPASSNEPLPKLNATDGSPVRVKDASIGGAGSIGPLTVSGGQVSPGSLTPPDGFPFSFLNVHGAITLDSKTMAQFGVRVGGTTAGEDNSQLTATGNVSLGGAQLQIFTSDGECQTLAVGNRYTIISAGGSVEGTFGGIPDGGKIEPICLDGVPPVLRINYTEHAVTATVLEPKPVNTSAPTISGNLVEGETLSATEGAWEHNPTPFSYQWVSCDILCAPISSATHSTYKLTSADVGDEIKVEVSAANPGGTVTATSAAMGPVLPRPPANIGAPTVTGIPVEGESLFAEHGSWERDPTVYAYQWLRCNSSGEACVEISGATAESYTPTSDDAGHTVSVEVKATNAGGTVGATSAPILIYPRPPRNSSPPAISGTVVEGETLSASPGGWERGGAFTYEWLRCDSSASACTPISGAAGPSYTLTSADVGDRIEVKVSTSSAGGPVSATSAATAVVAAQQSGGGGTPGGDGGSGGGNGGSTSTPGTAVAGAKALVKGGKAAIALHCTGAGPCSGTLLLEVASTGKAHAKRRLASKSAPTIGRASFSIAAGGAATVFVHLTGKGQGMVRKAGKKGLEAQLAGTGLAPRQLNLQETK